MPKSTRKQNPDKVGKPRPDFPLFPHATGRWAKKVRGKFAYFGSVADDPKGETALEKWLDQKDDLLAGRTPSAADPAIRTVLDLSNHFLTHKRSLLTAAEITEQTFNEYYGTCERLIRVFGKGMSIDSIVAADFARLRADIAKQWGPIRLANEIQRVRGVFKYAYEAGVTDKPPRYGPGFKKPSANVLRQNRAKRGLRMFEREELLAVLAVATPVLKGMVLLAINAGLGNHDVATLPVKAVNLKHGWLTYSRPKTGLERRVPLWPETVDALKVVLAERHEPKNPAHKNLLFVSTKGESYISKDSGHRVAKSLLYYLDKAKIRWPGLTFYSLRHGFQTVAEGARDLAAVQSIMGHAPAANDMLAVYRERISDERLKAVVDHVHQWLFGADAKTAKPDETSDGGGTAATGK
ncbi:MAG: tyrosine-type recombinase/integrase [Thermoguttaceae bacterium]